MKVILKVVFAVLVSFFLMTSTGYAGHAEKVKYSGFLGDYPTFKSGPEGGADLVYVKEKVDFKAYNKIMIDKVVIFIKDDAKYKGIDPDELNKLSKAFYTAMSDALGGAYPLVNKPGKDVLRLRFAITDVVPSELQATITSPVQAGITYVNLGRASMEAELLDSVTNKRVACAIDTKAGERYKIEEGMGKWQDAEKAFQFWAKRFRKFLDDAHAR